MLFHEKLIQRRRDKGMTQEDLAERLSVSRQTVSKWENGECMPDADKFIRLSDILEISRPAVYRNGVYTVDNLPAGHYDKMVLVLNADGLERSALVARNLTIDADGASWSNPD